MQKYMGEQFELDFLEPTNIAPTTTKLGAIKNNTQTKTKLVMNQFRESVGNFHFVFNASDIEYDEHGQKIKRIKLKVIEGDQPAGTFQIYIENYTISRRQNHSNNDIDDGYTIAEKLKFSSITKIDKSHGGPKYCSRYSQSIQTFEYFSQQNQ